MAIFDVPITWGSIRLWARDVDVDVSRTLVPHELAQGDDHPLHDAGLGPRPVRLSLLFDEFPGESSAEDRLQRLLAQHRTGRSFVFSHPLVGSFPAKIGSFSIREDEDTVTSADVEFWPDEGDRPVSPASAGVPAIAGEESVSAAADELDAALDEIYIAHLELEADEPRITDQARELVAAWTTEDGEVPTRQINTDVASVTNAIDEMIAELGLEDDLALFDVWLAAIKLGESVRNAAQAATSEVDSVFTIRVAQPTALLALCAQIYGGLEAQTRERQIRELNDLRGSAWVGPGEIVVPATGARI